MYSDNPITPIQSTNDPHPATQEMNKPHPPTHAVNKPSPPIQYSGTPFTSPEAANIPALSPQMNYVPYKPFSKPRAVYSEADRLFSVLALVLGFVSIKVILNMADSIGLMATVLCETLTLFNFFYCRKKQMKGTKQTKMLFIATLVLSMAFVISDNVYVKVIDFWFVLVSNAYFVYASYSSNNNSIILNVFKAVCASPFYEFGSLFEALFKKSSKPGITAERKNIFTSVIGVLLSIPVCIVVMVLLMSSDQNFGRGLESIFDHLADWFFEDLFSNIMQFVFSIPIAMYIFGAVFSRAYKMNHENELPKHQKSSFRLLPSSMCNAFLSPLILIYVAFVFTQASYLFTTYGTANENFDYSQYARSGFFELCAVAIINLSVISAIIFLVKLENKSLPKSVKIFIILFSSLTLCLIITAIAKMLMYINMYGMTPLRIYTSVFMIYLFVMFVVMIVKQFAFSISFTKTAYALAAIVLVFLAVLPVDGYIARYNINMYEKGEIDWIGYSAMEELDASAVSVFAECDPNLAANADTYGCPIKYYFRDKSSIGDMDIYSFNFTRLFAAKKVSDFNEENHMITYDSYEN